ncbi:MAG: hypothetical protein K8W52_02360 [Deltaproteobacteria bacterium]|nr:hypothetical protein [Deltaproteobacteria bacterium]
MRASASRAVVFGIALSLAACSLPPSDFHATEDAAPSSDGNPDALEPLAIVVSAPSLTVPEGQSQTFNVHLNRAPGATVAVQIAPTTPSDKLSVQTPELTFDDSNFGDDKAVTVQGTVDADTLDETVELTLTAVGVTGVTPVTISVTVNDPDEVAIVTDIGASGVVQVDENGTVDVRVHLSARPSGNVTVAATLGTGPVFANPTMVTFMPGNYDADQTFTFSTPVDANTISEDVSLKFSGTGVADVNYTVHVVDADVLNIATAPSSLIINEESTGSALQVSLTQQPASSVTVTLTTDNSKVGLDKTTLQFTTTDWGMPQTVNVTAPADPDTADGADTIRLNVNVVGVVERTVGVTIHDNDTQAIKEDAPPTVTLAENGTATFDVWLAYQPAAPVTVNVASLASGVATATPATLVFNASNYDQHQTVTIKGTDDPNLLTNTATVRLSEGSIGMVDIPVSVTDDDTQVITLSKTTSTIVEPGSDSFTAALGFDPGGTVSVTVASNDPGVDVFPTTLTFNSSNYAMAKTVNLSAVDDADANSIDTTVDLSGAGATLKSVAVHVTDNDTVALVLDQTGIVSIAEGGGVDVKVHLAAKPNSSVTITPQIGPGTAITVTPTSQTIAPSAYATDVTFHFAAGQDGNATSEDIPVTFHPSVAGIADVGITLRTVDDDVLGIALSTTALNLVEQGTPGTFDVSLSAMPSGTVTVTLSSSSGDASLNKTSLTFTTSTWSMPQTVTVTAPMDANTLPGSATISLAATGLTTRTVAVAVTDDDTQAIQDDVATSLAVTEGSSTTFQVRLAFDPVTPLTVTVASLDASLAAPSATSQTLTFDSSNYSTTKTVTINGVQDQNLASGATTIRLTSPGLTTVNIPINVTDDDTQVILATASSVTVPEGSSVQFDVSLKFDPGGTVNLALASGNATALPVTPGTIQFTSANYSSPVHVTVSAPADRNITAETTDIGISGAGATALSIAAQVTEKTVEAFPGWPGYFGQTGTAVKNVVLAYRVHIDDADLDYFAVRGTAGGSFRMALYTDVGNAPSALVSAASMPVGQAFLSGVETQSAPFAGVHVTPGFYWLAILVDVNTAVGVGAAGQTGPRCQRSQNMTFSEGWHATFDDFTPTCNSTAQLYNIWMRTFHQ